MSKSKNQRNHGRRRFKERYGIRYSQFVLDSIKHKIHLGQMKNSVKQSLRVSVFDVDIVIREKDIVEPNKLKDGDVLTIRVVYDRQRENIVSALPRLPDIKKEEEPKEE